MALRPFTPHGWNQQLWNVRVYLDDIEALAKDLDKFGTTKIVVRLRDGRLFVPDVINDLAGREDIVAVAVHASTLNDHEQVKVDAGPGIGVVADVGTNRHDVKVTVENYLASLERVRRPKLALLLLSDMRLDLILSPRASTAQASSQRRHAAAVAVLSAVAGGVLAIVGSILTGFLER